MMIVQRIVVHKIAELKGRNAVVFILSGFLVGIVLNSAAKVLQISEIRNRYMHLHTHGMFGCSDYQLVMRLFARGGWRVVQVCKEVVMQIICQISRGKSEFLSNAVFVVADAFFGVANVGGDVL